MKPRNEDEAVAWPLNSLTNSVCVCLSDDRIEETEEPKTLPPYQTKLNALCLQTLALSDLRLNRHEQTSHKHQLSLSLSIN